MWGKVCRNVHGCMRHLEFGVKWVPLTYGEQGGRMGKNLGHTQCEWRENCTDWNEAQRVWFVLRANGSQHAPLRGTRDTRTCKYSKLCPFREFSQTDRSTFFPHRKSSSVLGKSLKILFEKWDFVCGLLIRFPYRPH